MNFSPIMLLFNLALLLVTWCSGLTEKALRLAVSNNTSHNVCSLLLSYSNLHCSSVQSEVLWCSMFEPPIAFIYYKDWIRMFVVNFFWFVITSFWWACSTWKNWRRQCPWNGFWKFPWLRSSPGKQGCPGGSYIFVQVSWSPRKGFLNYSGYSHTIQVKGTQSCIFLLWGNFLHLSS